MKRILDTSVFVDALRGNDEVRERMQAHDPAGLATCSIVRGELMVGVGRSRDSQREHFRVDLMLHPIAMFNFDDRAARAFGILTVMLQKAGTMIGVPDLMIAATALSRGAIVVTSNPRDFGRVPGLVTENWRNL